MVDVTLLIGLGTFYLINLALGLYQGRNIRTTHTYVFGNSYSTSVLLLTLTGTFIGADYLTHWPRLSSGVVQFFLWIGTIFITGLLVAFYLFPKLRTFKNWYTLGDIVRQAYGSRHAQIAVEGVSVISSVILLSAQLVAVRRVGGLLGVSQSIGLAPYVLVISFTLVVVAYASRAGSPGVVSTDVLQMVLILGGTAFIAYSVLTLDLGDIHIAGLKDLLAQVKGVSTKDTVMCLFQLQPSLRRQILSATGGGLLLFSPAFIKRVGMASDNRQLKQSMIGFITVYSLFMLMLLISSFGLFIVHKNVINYSDVFPTLLQILSRGTWMKLLLLMMFMAAVMSTADSVLTAASLCAVRMMMACQTKDLQVTDPSLRKLRQANVVVGLLALVLALFFMHQPAVDFVVFARSVLGALLPCMIGIGLGIKKSEKALLGSMACFGLLFIGSIILVQVVEFSFLDPKWTNIALRMKYKPFVPFVALLSVLAYVLFEAMVHGGLKWEPREQFTEPKPSILDVLRKKEKVTLWSNPIVWAEERLERYESRGVLLLILCLVTSCTSMLSTVPLNQDYLNPMGVLLLVVFTLCTFNLFPEHWWPKLRVYYPLYWMVSLIVCVPCAWLLRWLYHPTYINAFYLVSIPVFMYGLIGRELGISLSVIGYLLGFGVYKLTADTSIAFSTTDSMMPLAFLLLTTSISWFLLDYHTKRIVAKAQRPGMWAGSWGHDLSHLFMELQVDTGAGFNPLPKGEKEGFEEAKRRLNAVNERIAHAIEFSKMFRDLIVKDTIRESELELVPLSEMMDEVYKTLKTDFKEMVVIKGKAPIKVKLSKTMVKCVTDNIFRNAWKAGATKIEVDWSAKEPILYIRDNGPGIPEHKLATLFEYRPNRDGTGIGLPAVKEMLAQMGALIDVHSSDKGATFMILFEQGHTTKKEEGKL